MRRVLCAGLVTDDLFHRVDRVPARNEKRFDEGQLLTVGGPATNAARTVAALGIPVRLVAPYGESPVTRFVARTLAAEEVEWVDPLSGSPNPTPLSSGLIEIDSGDRAVIAGGTRRERVPVATEAWLTDIDAVLVDGHGVGLPEAVSAGARTRGIPTVLDGGSWKPGMADYLPAVDVALLSEDFVAPDGADPVSWALAAGATCAGRTAGAGAIVLRDAKGERGIPIERVPVVDTLGAGDVLHGAAAAALAGTGGDRARMTEAVAFAATVATASVQYAGALGWAANCQVREALRERLRRLPGADR